MIKYCPPDPRLGRGDETKVDDDMVMPMDAINNVNQDAVEDTVVSGIWFR